MGRKNTKGKRIVYNKRLLIHTRNLIFRIVYNSGNLKIKGEGLVNPSVGKLRAWADPFRGVNVVIGVAY